MAKTDKPKFEINDYEPAPKANVYDEHVAALIAAGDGKTLTIRVPEGKGTHQRILFQRAANARDKTARVVEAFTEVGEDVLTFVLKPRERRATVSDVAPV